MAIKIKTEPLYRIQYVEPTLVKEQESKFNKINCVDDIITLLSDLQNNTKEKFYAIHLNNLNTIICIEIVHIGGMTESIVDIRALFRTCFLVNATAIIVAHNHPSGEVIPSVQDHKITTAIKAASKILNINLLDHVIVGENDYYSFQEEGLI